MDLAALADHAPTSDKLDAPTLARHVAVLGARWKIDGPDLALALPSPPMAKCGAAVAHATKLADELNHHPSIVMEYPGTTLKIHNHDAKAITMIDVVYAARLERWLRANGW